MQTSGGQFACQSLVIATGGLSIPTLGATGFGYQVARQFGHTLLPTRAGLVPFTITEPQLKALCTELSGTSLDCTASCNGTSFRENLLFTHRGLSGPAILQISSFWEAGDTVEINLLPDRDALTWLQQMQAERANTELKTVLGEVFTRKLANLLAEQWFESRPMKQYTGGTGTDRREAGELAGGTGRHRGLSHCRSDPGRRGYPRGVVQDHGIAEKPWVVFHW